MLCCFVWSVLIKMNKLEIEPLIVGPLFSNCYIIWDEKEKIGIIIDPGDDGEDIIKKVNELKIKIKYIIITHGHFDHIGAVNKLKKYFKVDFLAHKGDLFFIKEGKNSAMRWGVDIESSPEPDAFINEGDNIKFGQIELKVIHTPGHSPGGVSLLYDKVVFVGDTLFQGSIGRTDFRKGSLDELKNSIKNKLYKLPDDTIVYTGHGPITTIGDEKKYNSFVRA